jgi:hypothetical protein
MFAIKGRATNLYVSYDIHDDSAVNPSGEIYIYIS